MRGPLPPFFGSSTEGTKVEVVPAPELMPAVSPPPPTAYGLAGDQLHGPVTSPAMSPAPWAAAGLGPHDLPGMHADAGAVPGGGPNRKAAELLDRPAADGGIAAMDGRPAAPDNPPQVLALPGLEAMVAELLRPLLRRWLDENMPRLVSAALRAEAELMAKRDPKKP
ncbi:MAG: DUF2497 domain-containing protein [Hyphomicrobiaceae bacterium]|nr:DUF2497 domain-containing protein [Hyphomicrobiaceae bacterium]